MKSSDYKQMPWKNGGGLAYEIDRYPSEGEYLWRLSQARVDTDGPFSQFPGYDRLLVVCQGAGLWLNDQLLKPYEVLHFPGGRAIRCRLANGPVLDLGLIFSPDQVRAEMRILASAGSVDLPTGQHFLFCSQTRQTAVMQGPGPVQIPASAEPLIVVSLELI